LIFEQLYNLPASHAFWKNDLQFTREVFTNSAAEVIREFAMNGNTIDVKERVAAYKGSKPPREIFKRFYKDAEFQKLLVSGAKPYNPWKYWVESNQNVSNKFLTTFKSAMCNVMQYGYAVDVAKLATLEVKLKRV
jgi:hypothetical protein